MFKRLLLVETLVTIFTLPAFANAISGSDQMLTNESRCDADTLGVSEGSVTIKAQWSARNYTCSEGNYLDADTALCTPCPAGSYCGGFEDVAFDDSNIGIRPCPDDYENSEEGTSSDSGCYKLSSVSCESRNPYVYGHGVAVYRNASTQCRQFYGNESCNLIESDACDIVGLECDGGYESQSVDGHLECVSNRVHCAAGTYLPAGQTACETCLADHYCPVGDYEPGGAVDQGITVCPDGLKSPAGTSAVQDCGRILRIGENDRLYLHADKRTHPSLAVKVDGKMWYANLTPISEGARPISEGTTKTMHVVIDGVEYTVHTAKYKSGE